MKRCESKLSRKACRICYQHRALFRYRGRVHWDRQHDLCFACFRSVRDRVRSYCLARARAVWPASEVALILVSSAERPATFAGATFPIPPGASMNLVRHNDSEEVCLAPPAR